MCDIDNYIPWVMLQFSNRYAYFQLNEQLRKNFWIAYKVSFLESLECVKAVINILCLYVK